jgi:hypothetical protein
VARRSSKRASGTGKETETAQDAVTEEAVEAASTEAEHPETDTAGETTAEASASDAPGTIGKAPDSAETPSEDTPGPEDKSWDEAMDATDETTGPVSGEVLDTDVRTDAVEKAEVSASAKSEGEASDETGTVETAETLDETREATAEEAPEETPPPAEETPPPKQTVVEKRGPGFFPLVLGGVVAAGIGYFASMSDLLPGFGTSDTAPRRSRPRWPGNPRFWPRCRSRCRVSARSKRQASI